MIVSLSLAEGTFALTALYAGENGHSENAGTCLELINTFIHIFLIACSLTLVLGLCLLGTPILPGFLPVAAVILGLLFQLLGVAGLFIEKAVLLVICNLILQNIWERLLLRFIY